MFVVIFQICGFENQNFIVNVWVIRHQSSVNARLTLVMPMVCRELVFGIEKIRMKFKQK
jgi:hypothetical protein